MNSDERTPRERTHDRLSAADQHMPAPGIPKGTPESGSSWGVIRTTLALLGIGIVGFIAFQWFVYLTMGG